LDFEDPVVMAERVSLVTTLMYTALIQPKFAAGMELLRTSLGPWCSCSTAGVKGYARAYVKTNSDYKKLASPRAQWIMDPLRCLMTGPGVVSIYAILTGLSNQGDGLLQLKNPFALDDERREQRAHLLLMNGNIIFDAGMTIGELVTGSAAENVFADFGGLTDHGEPQERWVSMCKQARSILQHGSLVAVQASAGAEVQVTLDAVTTARGWMHYAYDCNRASTDIELYTNFAGIGKKMEEDEHDLYTAAFDGLVELVKEFLEDSDEDVEGDVDDRTTPLGIAAQNNHPDVIQVLLDAGADVDHGTEEGQTPLHIASEGGHVDVVRQLLAAGGDVNQGRTEDDNTPLMQAASNGHTQIVQLLLAARASVTTAATDDGTTALLQAASEGHAEIVKHLLAAGALVHAATTDDGTTSLHQAAQEGHTESVKLLLAAGASVDVATTDNHNTPLHDAARNGRVDVVQLLLAARAPVDAEDTDGITALHEAVIEGDGTPKHPSGEIVRVLIAARAGVDIAVCSDGQTPLHSAVEAGDHGIVQQLIRAGASVDVMNNDDEHFGQTPLYSACEEGVTEIVQQLIDARADRTLARTSGSPFSICETPFDVAKRKGHSEIVALLAADKADGGCPCDQQCHACGNQTKRCFNYAATPFGICFRFLTCSNDSDDGEDEEDEDEDDRDESESPFAAAYNQMLNANAN
jgi:ankyrin repeat protein